MPVNLNTGGFTHQVEQDPDADVLGLFLNYTDGICKWAWFNFHVLACTKVLQRYHLASTVASRAQANDKSLLHRPRTFRKAKHTRERCRRLSLPTSKGLALDHRPLGYTPRTAAVLLSQIWWPCAAPPHASAKMFQRLADRDCGQQSYGCWA